MVLKKTRVSNYTDDFFVINAGLDKSPIEHRKDRRSVGARVQCDRRTENEEDEYDEDQVRREGAAIRSRGSRVSNRAVGVGGGGGGGPAISPPRCHFGV